MIMRKLACALALVLLPSVAAAAGAGGPMATLKQKNSEVDKLLRQKVEKGSPAEQKQKSEIKQLAATLLDYDELAQKSLAAHWDKLTPAQRTEFVATLRELIERNYVKQLRTNLEYSVSYKNEEVVITGDREEARGRGELESPLFGRRAFERARPRESCAYFLPNVTSVVAS